MSQPKKRQLIPHAAHGARARWRNGVDFIVQCNCGEVYASPWMDLAMMRFEEHQRAELLRALQRRAA